MHAILPIAMKMTMHIDEDVLKEVVELTGAKSKTEAVEMALKEMARKHKMRKLFRAGMGLAPGELAADFASKPSDPLEAHGLEMKAAEALAPYGTPHPTGQ
ncbi:MAG TPA: type II toxin-antitoxin system VapB family antitoxin [Opitutaceae bacterium]|nr:type II toxin-antitoxin system VapB family antitoxin [Opitutaceae bacterium]